MPIDIELTVIGARNIKAGDIGGTSDGYVKIKVGSKQEKTKIAKPSLSPNWNEKFNFKVELNEEITFQVFDHDKIGRDDKLGTVKYHIPQLINGDTIYEVLKIDVKGHLYVSIKCMSGGVSNINKSVDKDTKVLLKIDIQDVIIYPFLHTQSALAKLNYTVPSHNSNYNVLVPGSTSVITSFYQDSINNMTLNNRVAFKTSFTDIQKTKRVTESWLSKFEEYFYCYAKTGEKINFDFLLKMGMGAPDVVFTSGSWILPDLRDGEEITARISSKSFVTFNVKIQCLQGIYHNVSPNEIPPIYDPKPGNVSKYELFIEKAEKLKGRGPAKKSDPYIIIKSDKSKKQRRTIAILDNPNPKYMEAFKIRAAIGEDITFNLFDMDRGKNEKLGDCTLKVPVDMKEEEIRKFTLDVSTGDNAKLFVELKKMRDFSCTYSTKYLDLKPAMNQTGMPPLTQYPPQGYPPTGYYPPPQGYTYQPGMPPMGYYPQMNQYTPQGYPAMGYYPPNQNLNA